MGYVVVNQDPKQSRSNHLQTKEECILVNITPMTMLPVTIPAHHRHLADILRPRHRSTALRLSALQFLEADQVFSAATFVLAMDRCWLPALLNELILCCDSSRHRRPS